MSEPTDPWARFFERFESDLPLDDMLGWILRHFPRASERQVLAMVQRICDRDYLIRPSADEERSYDVAGDTWTSFPQSVERRTSPPLA